MTTAASNSSARRPRRGLGLTHALSCVPLTSSALSRMSALWLTTVGTPRVLIVLIRSKNACPCTVRITELVSAGTPATRRTPLSRTMNSMDSTASPVWLSPRPHKRQGALPQITSSSEERSWTRPTSVTLRTTKTSASCISISLITRPDKTHSRKTWERVASALWMAIMDSVALFWEHRSIRRPFLQSS